ncbi:MAG: NAD(P)-dependent oxidoreductase, partial [Chloroflexota bacterium]|nr:NAD(P)-dependent oxidoreductase [Chloroflexota bacterium]
WFLGRPHNEVAMCVWLSHDDAARLVRCSLEARITSGVYYGISNNTRRVWDIENARQELGYTPLDDSETFASGVL